MATIIVGISLGLQVIGNRAQAISNDPSAISLLERGYEHVLPAAIKAAVDPVKESLERSDKALQQVIDLVRKLTDGVPESSKQTPTPASSTTYGSFPDGKPLGYTSTSTTDVGTGSKPATGSTAFPSSSHGS